MEGRNQQLKKHFFSTKSFEQYSPSFPPSPETGLIILAARCFDMFLIMLRPLGNRWWDGLSDMVEVKSKGFKTPLPSYVGISSFWIPISVSQEFKSKQTKIMVNDYLGMRGKSSSLGYLGCHRILEESHHRVKRGTRELEKMCPVRFLIADKDGL